MKRNVVIFNAYSIFETNKVRSSWLTKGVTEGLSKAAPLFEYLNAEGFSVIYVTDTEASTQLCISDIQVEVIGNSRQFYELTICLNPVISIFWNGAEYSIQQAQWWLASQGSRIFYLEYGFFPQNKHIRISTGFPLSAANRTPRSLYDPIAKGEVDNCLHDLRSQFPRPDPHSKVLVLQTDYDSSLLIGSPFQTMQSFIEYLLKAEFDFSDIAVRFHPKMPSETKAEILSILISVKLDSWQSSADSLSHNEFFFGINSTLLQEAILVGRKVINFGQMFSEESHAMYSGDLYATLGFDDHLWNSQKPQRDKSIYFLYKYRQFQTCAPLSSEFQKFFNTLACG